MKKNKYGSVPSESELDISAALDYSMTVPKEPTSLSDVATASFHDTLAVLAHIPELAQQMYSEALPSQSHITISPSENDRA